MPELWAVNASPLIVLAKIGRLELITALAETVLVPDAVAEELLAGPSDDPARLAIQSGWGHRLSPRKCPPAIVEWGLGDGETAVISLTLEHQGSTAILDDAAARAAARTYGIRTLGTIGILVRAKLKNFIPSAREAISEVRSAGLYIDDAIVDAVLAQIGED